MQPEERKEYKAGELWIGPCSWDKSGKSIKYAYLSEDMRISRGAPEVLLEDLVAMIVFVIEKNMLSKAEIKLLKDCFDGK
jgi:hypothetical protein